MGEINNLYNFIYNFFTPDPKGESFEPFSTIHIITLIVIALANFVIISHYKRIIRKKDKRKGENKGKDKDNDIGININIDIEKDIDIDIDNNKLLESELGNSLKKFRHALAAFLLLNEAVYTVWSVATGDWTIGYSLPLHLCDMSMFFSVIMLVTKNYFLYEITYFWGLGGSLQALITPDLYPYNFPHFIYFNFFLAHSCVITAVLFMTLVENFQPTRKSILKTIIFTNMYMAVIAVINILTNGNYMFLCHKPNNPSIMDYLGPWPWYILGLEGIGVVTMCILCIPYLKIFRRIKLQSLFRFPRRFS